MGVSLLTNISVDTVGDAFELPRPGNIHANHQMAVYVWATSFGSGTVRLEVSPDGTNWFTARTLGDSQATFTTGDMVVAHLRGARYVRGRLDGSSGASGVNMVLY